MAEAPKKKYIRWVVLFAVTGIVDLAQILIDLTGIGIVVSEAIEVAMPFVMGLILFAFKILNVQTGLSVAVALVTDAVTGGFAPFWIADAWYIYRKVRKQEAEQAAAEAAQDEASQSGTGPLNRGGMRSPAGQRAPLNAGGMRQPVDTDEGEETDETEETEDDEEITEGAEPQVRA
jgi:hypothetical protein